MELKQLLGLDQLASPRGRQLQQLTVLHLYTSLLVTDVDGVKVALGHEALAQRGKLLYLLAEVLHVKFDGIELLQQSLLTSSNLLLVKTIYVHKVLYRSLMTR